MDLSFKYINIFYFYFIKFAIIEIKNILRKKCVK